MINNICLPAKVPVIAGEEGICSGCGVATLSIDYYDIGYKAGEMGAEILMDGKDVKEMPIEFAPEVTKKYNKANCEALGITVPDDYVAVAKNNNDRTQISIYFKCAGTKRWDGPRQWVEAPTDRSQSDCVHEQAAKRIANVRFYIMRTSGGKRQKFCHPVCCHQP